MVPIMVILWVLWKLKLHQLIHLFFSNLGNEFVHCSYWMFLDFSTLQFSIGNVPYSVTLLCWLSWCLYSSSVVLCAKFGLFCTCILFYLDVVIISLKLRSITWGFFCRYSGRGLFLDPPTVYIKSGVYNISLPQSMQHDPQTYGDTCQFLVFDTSDLIPYGCLFSLFSDSKCRLFFTSWNLLQDQGQNICCWFVLVLYKAETIRIFFIK